MLAQTMRRRILLTGGSGVLSTIGPAAFGAAAVGAGLATGAAADDVLSGVVTSPDGLSTICNSSVI
jgi:hypothetical protein